MASNKEYLEYILEQLSELEEITYRTMMGEFIIYYRGKIVGGIYDDRLLVKPVKSAVRYMPTAPYELPYDGAKRMLLVEEVDNKKFLTGLFDAMYAELPAPKQKKGKQILESPILNKELDSKTFRNYYFLKVELMNFCRENGMPTSGSKIEIADRIAYFLDTGKIKAASAKRKDL